MIEIPDLAAGGLAAGTLSAFVLGGGLLRSRRQRARQSDEIAALRSHLDMARQEVDRATQASRQELDRAAQASRQELERATQASRQELDHAAQAFTAEIVHLAEQRIPAEATRAAHPHIQVPGHLHPELEGTEIGAGLDDVLTGLLTALAQERKRVDAAARAGMRGATREIQAGLYRLQDVLRGLQQRYDDPELAQTLFALDHENEQSLRRAQVAAVVCGAWVGLAREESHLVEAVTGGQSRLVGYHRVQIHNHLEEGTALVSHAVEPVAIIVAELLDNALRHSSPDTSVVVNLERAHHGVSVTIDDAGVGMAADERAYAQRMVAGREPILLSELGDPPRMGLAAIGQLTRQFDLSVDLSSPSPYGGVRAVLLVKNHLLSHIDAVLRPPAASAPRSTRQAETASSGPQAEAAVDEDAATTHLAVEAPYADVRIPAQSSGHSSGHNPAHRPAHALAPPASAASASAEPAEDGEVLPQRRRRVRADQLPGQAPPVQPKSPARSPEEAAAALGALQTGTAAARSAHDTTEGNDPR
ncbi:ATP-binding protein [Streptomyces sp. NPDC051907]|uniref:ATP-binding protein n=1 Tax=Streptomyces sp. NPDC051907 TaxID=3155284 RepID=UPI0034191276